MKKPSAQAKQPKIEHVRHSLAHLLATAALAFDPKAQLGIGPVTENGFYYDFLFSKKVDESVLPELEEKMRALIREDIPFTGRNLSFEEARKAFKGQTFKLELVSDLKKYGTTEFDEIQKIKNKKAKPQKAAGVSVYESGPFADLCRGGHVKRSGEIPLDGFRLASIAGAYWRGSEKNSMLTRIYGIAFGSKNELDEYLKAQEEAAKRDHRKIGRDLELFLISDEVGPGLTLWLPNGALIRREIENYQINEQTKMGYQHVYSPHIGMKSLWVKSGHWDLYREKMYSPMDIEGAEYLVKPMTCPMHIQSYKIKLRSYRDLPLRIAEIAAVYRYEQSGELNGLLRVRAFTQDDAHIFCTEDQAVDEFLAVFNFIRKLYGVFGFSDYRVRLGVRSKKEKYLGNDAVWKQAEEKIIAALKKANAEYSISEGDAAFYGPKADFLIRDALGREWQCGTVQVDFMLPQRFGLRYIDRNNKEQVPVMVHRAPLGSLERFLALLIENYGGAFPLWLAPVQVAVLPIADRHAETARNVVEALRTRGIRAELDDHQETLNAKIRAAQVRKVPYMAIIGDKEQDGSVSVRSRDKGDLGRMTLEKFADRLDEERAQKS